VNQEPNTPGDVTRQLQKAASGDEKARRWLFEVLYDEVRSNARSQRYVGKHGDTLQPTALANEAFVEFLRKYPSTLENAPDSRRLFFYTIGLVMKSILRDDARKRGKIPTSRGTFTARGSVRVVALGDHDPESTNAGGGREVGPEELADAIDRLRDVNERWAEVVHYRFFAGQSIEATAEFLGVARSTVAKDWRLAQAWLAQHLDDGTSGRVMAAKA